MISICSKTNRVLKLQTSYSCYCLDWDRLKRADYSQSTIDKLKVFVSRMEDHL